jgi:hypothetical protein
MGVGVAQSSQLGFARVSLALAGCGFQQCGECVCWPGRRQADEFGEIQMTRSLLAGGFAITVRAACRVMQPLVLPERMVIKPKVYIVILETLMFLEQLADLINSQQLDWSLQ